MIVQRFEDRDLRGIEERFDLLVRALDDGLNLLMFLVFAQACILEDRFNLLIPGDQNGLDFPLLGVAKAQFGCQHGELLIGAGMMVMMPFLGAGRRSGSRRCRLSKCEAGKER